MFLSMTETYDAIRRRRLALVVSAAVAVICLLLFIKYRLLKKEVHIVFSKTLGILLRMNGFLIGAIGIDMIIKGFFAFRG